MALVEERERLEALFGLTVYNRKFIKGYESIVAPLNSMLNKGNFKQSENGQLAFESLKQANLFPPMLQMSNFDLDFVIECNASGTV